MLSDKQQARAEIEAEKEAWGKLVKEGEEHLKKIDAARESLREADKLIHQTQETIAKWIKEDSSDE